MEAPRPSHRSLGVFGTGVPRQRVATEGSAADADYPAFAETRSPATGLDLPALRTLAGAIGQNTAQSTVPERLNAPDGAGHEGLGAGYTYLWQLAGHDLAMTRITGAQTLFAKEAENQRRRPLACETLLGGGVLACPHAYVGPVDAPRLRTGRLGKRDGNGPVVWSGPARDLPRARQEGAPGGDPDDLDIVLIPDPRNDDNLILAQLTALFHHVANRVLEAAQASAGLGEDPERLAHDVMRGVWRRLLRRDLLPRILHPRVRAAYDRPVPPRAGPTGAKGRPPAEFVFAAMRLGHGMVRDRYQLNAAMNLGLKDVILQASSQRPGRMPMRPEYLIDWSLFFPMHGAGPAPAGFNWAFRFGAHLAQGMLADSAASTPLPGEPKVSGTAFRDLYRGDEAGLATAPELEAAIRQRSPDLADAAFGAPGATDWDGLVRAGLDRLQAPDVAYGNYLLTEDQRAAILGRPPLALLLMFEAEARGEGGRRLGPLGSILVAEGMRAVFEAPPAGTQDRLEAIETEALGSVIGDMPALIRALQTGLADLFPPPQTTPQEGS